MPILWFWLFALIRFVIYTASYLDRRIEKTRSRVDETEEHEEVLE